MIAPAPATDRPIADDAPRATGRDGALALRPLVMVVLVHVAALAALFLPSRTGLLALLVAHFVTGCLGISVGFHRLLSHRSFSAPAWVQGVLAICGTLALQTGPISWVTLHRAHHRHSDGPQDPHSSTRGFFFSHMQWIFYQAPNGFSYLQQRSVLRDLRRQRLLRILERHFLTLNLAALALCLATLGPVVTLWVFPLRIVLVWHGTWLVNSFGHGAPGGPPAPRNVPWATLLSYGENWHVAHHESPSSVRFGRRAQLDLGYLTVRAMALCGLATIPARSLEPR